jgi:phosphoribosylformylglycinamidine synthase
VLGTPVTGGNVSFYNQTGETAILPTPVVGVLGVLEDVSRRTPLGFTAAAALILLGDTAAELGGSEWAWTVHGHLGGRPPAVDLDRERLLADVLVDAARDGLLAAAHDLSDGGLAQALVESCLRGGAGAHVELPPGADPFVWLFSESAGRAVVAVPPATEAAFSALCTARGLPWTTIGHTDPTLDALELAGAFAIPLPELREAWTATLPRLFET